MNQILKLALGKVEKHCGKRQKCWLPVFSPFPTMFSKGFFHRVVKSWDCVVESQSILQWVVHLPMLFWSIFWPLLNTNFFFPQATGYFTRITSFEIMVSSQRRIIINSWVLTTLKEMAFENIVGKRENAGNQCLLLCQREIIFLATFNFFMCKMLSIWSWPKFCRLGKG